jgi:hypothetical protein
MLKGGPIRGSWMLNINRSFLRLILLQHVISLHVKEIGRPNLRSACDYKKEREEGAEQHY